MPEMWNKNMEVRKITDNSKLRSWAISIAILVGGSLALTYFAVLPGLAKGLMAFTSMEIIGAMVVLLAVYWATQRTGDETGSLNQDEMVAITLLVSGVYLVAKGFPFATYNFLGLQVTTGTTFDLMQVATIASGIIVALVMWTAFKKR